MMFGNQKVKEGQRFFCLLVVTARLLNSMSMYANDMQIKDSTV